MNVPVNPARMEPRAKMASMATSVTVLLAMKVCTVRQTQTSVPVTPVRMVPHVMMKSMDIPAPVLLDMQVSMLTHFNAYYTIFITLRIMFVIFKYMIVLKPINRS